MEQPKIKSFWEKPEGNTGMFVMAAGIIAVAVGAWYALPIIIILLSNVLYATFLGLSVAAVFGLIMNDKFRFLCSSMFQSAMRVVTGLFIAVDPIGILKNYLEEMIERLQKIERHIKDLCGQVVKLESNIKERTQNINHYMKLAQQAKKTNQTDIAALNANKAAREKHFVDKLSVTLEKMRGVNDILSKMKKNLNYLYEDTEHEVEIQEAEYESIKSASKAMKGAEALIEGDNNKAMFEQTMEYIANDIAMKLGEMDRFMDTSQNFITTMDLNNAIFNEEGLELLAQWEKNGPSIMDYEKNRGQKIRVDSSGSSGTISAEEQEQIQQEENNSFASIFNNK